MSARAGGGLALLALSMLLGTLMPSGAMAQTEPEVVESGRLKCTKQTRLRWDCEVVGNDTNPSGQWIFDPRSVGFILSVSNGGRNAIAVCEPIEYDFRNGQRVKRTHRAVVTTTYLLGPLTGLTRSVPIECDSGEPNPSEILLAYDVWWVATCWGMPVRTYYSYPSTIESPYPYMRRREYGGTQYIMGCTYIAEIGDDGPRSEVPELPDI